MTKDEFSRCLALVRVYWPNGTKAWTAEAVTAWESLLLHLDVASVAAAIQVIAMDGKEWPPTPGQIAKRTLELTQPLPAADEAWKEVRFWVGRIGWSKYGQEDFRTGEKCLPEWSNALIGRIVDAMGWQELCESENEVADRAHFMRMWAEASQHQTTLDHLPPAARAVLQARGVAIPDLSVPKELAQS